jgi:primosomal replication protein N
LKVSTNLINDSHNSAVKQGTTQSHWQVSVPILVTGYTNTAVDNLAEGLGNRGLKVLRYGAKIRIRESLWPITLDGYIERHSSHSSLNSLKLKTYAALPGSGM